MIGHNEEMFALEIEEIHKFYGGVNSSPQLFLACSLVVNHQNITVMNFTDVSITLINSNNRTKLRWSQSC